MEKGDPKSLNNSHSNIRLPSQFIKLLERRSLQELLRHLINESGVYPGNSEEEIAIFCASRSTSYDKGRNADCLTLAKLRYAKRVRAAPKVLR